MLKPKRSLNYANITATLALVFSMSGGALAANHYLINSTKQLNPKVLKSLKGKAGRPGPAGATGLQGPQGKEGSQGKEGTPGKAGANGTAVAYAHVVWNGTVAAFDASQTFGMGGATVTQRKISAFCFAGLPFTPKNVQITADYGNYVTAEPHVQVQILPPGQQAEDCSAGENVEVATASSKGFAPMSFYVLFN